MFFIGALFGGLAAVVGYKTGASLLAKVRSWLAGHGL